MKIKISKSETAFTIKPSDKQIKALTFMECVTSIEGLITHIEAGKSFTPATFYDNMRNGAKFKSQQLFAVDIDGTLSLEQINSICDDYGFTYNFIYPTFNHTETSPRYRLVFIMDGEVHSKEAVVGINKTLVKLFDGKADKACVDATRIFYGTNKKAIIGDLHQMLDVVEIIDKINFKLYLKDNKQTRSCFESKNIAKIPKDNSSENCGNERSSIIYINSDTAISTNIVYSSIGTLERKRKIGNWQPEDLFQIEIFRRFYNGEASGKKDKLDHNELFGIATNLHPLDGGEKLFRDCLRKNSNYSDEKYKLISYVRSCDFSPMPLNRFSPFDSDKNYQYQTFPKAIKKTGRINVYEKLETVPVEEVYPKFAKEFQRVIEASTNKIYLFLVAPGMGKSALARNIKNAVIAFPDHALKDEHYNASSLLPNEKVSTPNIKKRFSGKVEKYFNALYQIGLRKEVNAKINFLAKGKSILDDGSLEKIDVEAAIEYKKYLHDIREKNGKSVFTTHSRGLQMDWEYYDTVIFDEDPLNTILEKHTVTKSDLMQIYLEVMNYKDANKLHDLIIEPDFDIPKNTPDFNFDVENIYKICLSKKLKSKVLEFFNSEYYFINNGHIHYTVNNVSKFSNEKKYIICDATASEEIYKKLFGDRLEVINFKNITNKGVINQYTSLSYSKQGFIKYHEKLEKVLDTTLPTITHKNLKYMIVNHTEDAHFGRVRGTNVYENMSINVVGTFNYNDSHYKLLSATLDLGVTDFTMKKQLVRYDGREFTYTTFTHPVLQRLHLETVEGELLQAVHRPRLIRYSVIVNLHSSFPLAQAKYIY